MSPVRGGEERGGRMHAHREMAGDRWEMAGDRWEMARLCVAEKSEVGGWNLYQKVDLCTCAVPMRTCAELVSAACRVSAVPCMLHFGAEGFSSPTDRLDGMSSSRLSGYGQWVMGS